MIKVQKQSDELGYVGRITDVDVSIIKDNLDKGYIPVISTIGTDTNGQAYNINADTAAAKIAGALNAECMLSMTNIDGVLKDKDDPDSLLTEITLEQARQLENDGIIAGGMIPKVQCCTDASKPVSNACSSSTARFPMPSSSKCSPKKAWARCS